MRFALADLLLAQNRAGEVAQVLQDLPRTESVLIRLAESQAALHAGKPNPYPATLTDRLEAARAHAQRIHARDLARVSCDCWEIPPSRYGQPGTTGRNSVNPPTRACWSNADSLRAIAPLSMRSSSGGVVPPTRTRRSIRCSHVLPPADVHARAATLAEPCPVPRPLVRPCIEWQLPDAQERIRAHDISRGGGKFVSPISTTRLTWTATAMGR